MSFNKEKVKAYLQQNDFASLFIEELGWDNATANQTITIDDNNIELQAVAEKCGLIAFICNFQEDGDIPNYSTRLKIDKQLAKQVNQHLIIFTSADGNRQYWQWMRQETGKSAALRGQNYEKQQGSEILLQKLQQLYFSLEEEESFLTIADISGRVKSAFDIEKVTKKFYDEFKKKHKNFLEFIEGIPDEDLRWYASVIINRLMFIYFLQYKGFLNDDLKYLRTKLQEIKTNHGGGYYKKFLCPLFFEGFALKEEKRSDEIKKLLGKIPYLNGGLFTEHEIEQKYGQDINIKDKAFEDLFNFFDKYQWKLDERPLRDDNEINPDVLGYIFEKYINQKQMGAYYTQEDITEYMSKNTLIPWLFNSVAKDCKIAFASDSHLWRLLKNNPDRYIYSSLRHGVDTALPEEIIKGVNDISKRKAWNFPSGNNDCGLPSETWRETITRHNHYEEIKAKITNSEIHTIEDLITYNLDIKQFARDAIQYAEGADLVNAFWESLHQIKVLDPACGSGAFLFSALNILGELYHACLVTMQMMIDEIQPSNDSQNNKRLSGFKEIIDEIKKHPNRDYFIYKTIIVNNLYGVDIIEEGTEICKLRLFLKLAAKLKPTDEIEPLPDIDFNIKHGNSLVGYTSFADLEKSTKSNLDLNDLSALEAEVEKLDVLFDDFRQNQVESPELTNEQNKGNIEKTLLELEEKLDSYLVKNYGINPDNKEQYKKWKENHKPFHWWLQFYGIITDGGFDIIIGNPPYVRYKAYSFSYQIRGYETIKATNLYAFMSELATKLISDEGFISYIVPISAFSVEYMTPLMKCLKNNLNEIWLSFYHFRPAMLFDGGKAASIPTAVFIGNKSGKNKLYSTNIIKWYKSAREHVFKLLNYNMIDEEIKEEYTFCIPKISHPLHSSILKKVLSHQKVDTYISHLKNRNYISHRSVGGLYFKVTVFDWPVEGASNKKTCFLEEYDRDILVALFNSNLYWLYYATLSDTMSMPSYQMFGFRFNYPQKEYEEQLKSLAIELMEDFDKNAEFRKRKEADSYTIFARKSKRIIDKIDKVMAKHYGFTDEELDFIINYDIKFRMNLLRVQGEEEE